MKVCMKVNEIFFLTHDYLSVASTKSFHNFFLEIFYVLRSSCLTQIFAFEITLQENLTTMLLQQNLRKLAINGVFTVD